LLSPGQYELGPTGRPPLPREAATGRIREGGRCRPRSAAVGDRTRDDGADCCGATTRRPAPRHDDDHHHGGGTTTTSRSRLGQGAPHDSTHTHHNTSRRRCRRKHHHRRRRHHHHHNHNHNQQQQLPQVQRNDQQRQPHTHSDQTPVSPSRAAQHDFLGGACGVQSRPAACCCCGEAPHQERCCRRSWQQCGDWSCCQQPQRWRRQQQWQQWQQASCGRISCNGRKRRVAPRGQQQQQRQRQRWRWRCQRRSWWRRLRYQHQQRHQPG
jgi:hypothetical protein